MGYELSNFIDEVDEEYLCSICKQVLDNPLQLECEHIYCNECINLYVSVNGNCPIDRSTVKLEETQRPGRYYMNLLNKLRIKCDFHLNGCKTITKLEHQKFHLKSCGYNPNAEIVCIMCNIKMCQHEYGVHNCVTLLIHKTNDHKEVNAKLKNKASKLKTKLQKNKEKIARLNYDINDVRDLLEFYKNTEPDVSRKWKKCNNMETSALHLNILEIDDPNVYSDVQSRVPLSPSQPSFKIQIVNVQNSFSWISIGLTRDGHPESIGYSSHGELIDERITTVVGSKWGNGDIIEVGIEYPRNGDMDYPQIFFTRNETLVFEKCLTHSNVEAFPTIRILGNGYKVKCLNN